LVYANSGTLDNTTISNNFFHTLVTSTNRGGFSGFVRDGYVAGRRDSGTRILNNTFLIDTLGAANDVSVAGVIEYHDGSANRTGITHIEGNIFNKTTTNGVVFKFYMSALNPTPSPFTNNCYWPDSSGTNFADWFGAFFPTASNWIQNSGVDVQSFAADPQFVSSTVPFDLHVQPFSPCVGVMPTIPGVTVDYDGDPRLQTLTSIGADEYVSGCTVFEYETNNLVLSAVVNNTVGSACSPAILNLPYSFPANAVIASPNVGYGYEAIFANASIVPASAGAFVTGNGQLLNVPLNAGAPFFLNGGAVPSFASPFPGTISAPFLTPPQNLLLSMQVAIIDPTHPDFVRLSQATELQVP
jgi:hypothetical protein